MKRAVILILAFGMTAATLFSQASPSGGTGAATSPSSPAATPQAKAPASPAGAPVVTKDETVYAILDPSGAVKSIIVSDWLHADRPGIEIRDRSNLTAIENIKGYEVPSRVSDSLVWKLDGSDIYYRGKSTKPLPISVSIKYWLEGKPIEPAALAGRSGNIRVRIEVKNLAAADKVIDGVKRRLYAPMIVVIGMDLPVVGFSNIQLTGGKMLSDGQNNIAVGLLLPGMAENLAAANSASGGAPGAAGSSAAIDLSGLGLGSFAIPDAIEFTAKVDKFRMGSIYMAATPDFPDIGGPNTVAGFDDLLAKFQMLVGASKQIKEGSAALAAGTATLRDAIVMALEALKPVLAANKDFFNGFNTFMSSDANVEAARQLLDSGSHLINMAPQLIDAFDGLMNKDNQVALGRLMDTAKKLDLKDLIGAPLVGSLLSDASLASMAEALAASDDLYHGLDERRLQAAATFAAGATPLFDALVNFDETARNYNPADGAALQALGNRASEYEAAAGKMAQLGSWDAQAAAATLADRARSDANYLSATSFLDDPAFAALSAKLASGADLTDAERARLVALIAASRTERSAAQKASPVEAATAAALPAIMDAARLGVAARQAAAAASALSVKTLPGLAAARDARARTEQIVAAGRRVFDPKTVSAITTAVPRIFEVRKAYDKNRATFQAARTILAIRARNSGFKEQVALIDALQRELKALEPFLSSAQAVLASPDMASLLGDLKSGKSVEVQTLIANIARLQPLLDAGQAALTPENVAILRSLLGKMPELEGGIDQLLDGSKLLAEKMGELSAGTKQFDEEGIQLLADLVVDKASLLRNFLKIKDALSALAYDYRSYSGAPEGAKTRLKYILKTDEVK